MKRLSIWILLSLCLATSLVAGEQAKRYAVIIGINSYADAALTVLNSPRVDAKELGKTLEGTWEKTLVLTDDQDAKGASYPNKANIEKRLSLLADFADPGDTILVFFSGHGVSQNGVDYLLPADADTSKLEATAIPVADLVKPFATAGVANVILALDACREAVFRTKGLKVVGVNGTAPVAQAAAIFYATKPGWFSYESNDSKMSVFTRYLIAGLAGASSKTGSVTVKDLATWLPDAVSGYAMDVGLRQKPMVVINTPSVESQILFQPTSLSRTGVAIPAARKEGSSLSTQWPYFSLRTEAQADGQVKYSVTIKSAETSGSEAKVTVIFDYLKNADPILSAGEVLWNYPAPIDLSHRDKLFSIDNKELLPLIGYTYTDETKKTLRLVRPFRVLEVMLANDYVLLPAFTKKVRFKTLGLKDFLQANGLSSDEISKAMELSNQ